MIIISIMLILLVIIVTTNFPIVLTITIILWSHCSFPLSPGAHKVLFVPSKTGVYFHQPCGSLIIKSTGFQCHIPWGFPVPLLDPQAGKPDVGF